MDIDLWKDPGREFWAAVAVCRTADGAVPISLAAVASPPIDFEDRLKAVPVDGLAHIRIFIPEAHDLALMKTVRGEAHDLDAIQDLHRIQGLALETLILRFHETEATLIGPPARLKGNFLAMVARLFGDAVANTTEGRL